MIWIFTEGEGIESRLPFKIFSTLHWYMVARLEVRAQNPTLLHGSQHERFFFRNSSFPSFEFCFFPYTVETIQSYFWNQCEFNQEEIWSYANYCQYNLQSSWNLVFQDKWELKMLVNFKTLQILLTR